MSVCVWVSEFIRIEICSPDEMFDAGEETKQMFFKSTI